MARLLTIPLEIQHLICANLCRHCTGEPIDPNGPQQRQVSIFDGEEAFIMEEAKIRVAALSAMTLTLRILHLELDEDRKFPSCEPGSLPRLKELVVKTGEEVDIAVIAPIFHAAPALERLGAYELSCDADWETTPRPPIHEGLKEIWLESCAIGPRGFPAFVGLFPRLEVFTYETNGEGFGEEEASLQQIGEALLACPDLRSLSIDLTKNHTGGEVWPAHEFGSISKFKKLQKFRVRKLGMFQEKHHHHTLGPWTGPPVVKIYDMLPPSITELEVTRPDTIIFDDMLELSGMATERFPLLKHVSVDGIEQEWEDDHSHRHSALMGLERINKLRQAFGQNGIEVSTGDFGKYVGWATLRA